MIAQWSEDIRDVDGDSLEVAPVEAEGYGAVLHCYASSLDGRDNVGLFLGPASVRQLRDACNRFLAETGENDAEG